MPRNSGYSPSIMQNTAECYLCGRTTGKLDRHEPCGGPERRKSKMLGMWCLLCHYPCHLDYAHGRRDVAVYLKQEAQRAAMKQYGWSREDFIREFGKNYL